MQDQLKSNKEYIELKSQEIQYLESIRDNLQKDLENTRQDLQLTQVCISFYFLLSFVYIFKKIYIRIILRKLKKL